VLIAAAGCVETTPLSQVRDASLGLALWNCSGPNVPLGCDQAFTARLGIGGQGIGSPSSSPACLTLDSDLHASIDGESLGDGALGGEYEGDCEDVFFLHGWDAQPTDTDTSRIGVADDSMTFAMDIARLFGDRRIEITSPADGIVRRGTHVEARFVLPTTEDAIKQGSTFACDGDCPGYIAATFTDRTVTFDVPADADGPIKLGAHVLMPVTRCEGPTTCTATASISLHVVGGSTEKRSTSAVSPRPSSRSSADRISAESSVSA